MNVYQESVYLVIEVESAIFDRVTNHLISHSDDTIKYLLGNDREFAYINSLIPNVSHERSYDYFKIVRKD